MLLRECRSWAFHVIFWATRNGAVPSDEQKQWAMGPFSLLNDEHMGNYLGVED